MGLEGSSSTEVSKDLATSREENEADTVKLLYCASRGDVQQLERALQEGVNKNVADYDQRTALHLAASEGHLECVRLLLSNHVEINPRDRWGRTNDEEQFPRRKRAASQEDDTVKLLYCASRGDTEGLRRALEEGVNKNIADYDRRTALHLAASEGHVGCVKLLIENSVEINPKDRWGRTPLADARRYGYVDVCKILEAFGGTVTTDEEQLPRTPTSSEDDVVRILYCASRGDVDELRRALKDANKNAADYDKRTALHIAASEGHVQCVKLLIELKADLNPTDRWGRTPLADARKYGHKDVCSMLERAGATAMEAVSPEYEIDPAEIEDLGKDQTIAQGAFGEIRLVKWRGTKVAAKTIRGSLSADIRVVKDFMAEMIILQKLHHPNIVQFLGAVTNGPLVILTEYMPGGDLQALLRKRKAPLPMKQALSFALDIARGMNFLHELRPGPVIHRDLKPTNILLDEAGHVKVADFGLSRLAHAAGSSLNDVYNMTGETGSYRYMAPEVYKRQPYDKSVDVFSYAMVVYEMFEGHPANRFDNPMRVVEERAYYNTRPGFTMKYPPKMKQLLSACWDSNPQQRPSFRAIIHQLEEMEKTKLLHCTVL